MMPSSLHIITKTFLARTVVTIPKSIKFLILSVIIFPGF